jgi:precorrin-6A/cobalt-precorrin-6A reductase
MAEPRLLILGGTTEAAALAAAALAAGWDVETSLAGRTATPAALPGRVRVGGFGGADGLGAYLSRQRVGALVDATHPFAARIARAAAAAAEAADVPRLKLLRPAWAPAPGDRWIGAADSVDAAALLPRIVAPGTAVLLTIGRQEVAPFRQCRDLRFVLRSIEPPAPQDIGREWTILRARGPFDAAGEAALLAAHGIGTIVAKNSGGEATAAKLQAARAAGLTVVMIRRPAPPPGTIVSDVGAAMAWLAALSAGGA